MPPTGRGSTLRRLAPDRLPHCIRPRVSTLTAALDGALDPAPAIVGVSEALLRYVSAIWVAEYLHAGAWDGPLNRHLLGLFRRAVLIGPCVAVARRVRALFAERDLGTVTRGLAQLTLGEADEQDHPVARLIRYRNEFAHGSFGVLPEATRDALDALDRVVDRLPWLGEQVPRFVAEGRVHIAAECTDAADPAPDLPDLPDLHPFLASLDGAGTLPLHPLLRVEIEDGSPILAFGTETRGGVVDLLLEHEALRAFAERYEAERAGVISFEPALSARAGAARPPSDAARALATALADPDAGRILVEEHPGCGAPALVAALGSVAPADGFVSIAPWVVEPDGHGASGEVFARFVIRRAEAEVEPADDARRVPAERLLDRLDEARAALDATGRRLLIGIVDLHHGVVPTRGESLAVVDVHRRLGGAIRSVATCLRRHPALLGRALPRDAHLVLPVPEVCALDAAELRRAVLALIRGATGEGALRERVLRAIVAAGRPLACFALCDLLEADGGERVLTPAVERALVELGPLLEQRADGGDVAFAPFVASVGDALGEPKVST